jgi:hypothetical protein
MPVSPWMVSNELWELAEPLLPRRNGASPIPGRKRLDDREAGVWKKPSFVVNRLAAIVATSNARHDGYVPRTHRAREPSRPRPGRHASAPSPSGHAPS